MPPSSLSPATLSLHVLHSLARSRAQMIGARLANPRSSVRRLYLVVHNIDGPALRDRTAQQTLAALAALPSGMCAARERWNGRSHHIDVFCSSIIGPTNIREQKENIIPTSAFKFHLIKTKTAANSNRCLLVPHNEMFWVEYSTHVPNRNMWTITVSITLISHVTPICVTFICPHRPPQSTSSHPSTT
jgi:hypothetical protein